MDRREFLVVSLASAGALALEACDEARSPMPDGAKADLGPRELGPDLPVAASDGDATDLGPMPVGGPPQFLTWDGGSGPSKRLWSSKLALPWVHPGAGDWLDATQTSQGSAAYASAEVKQAGPVSLEVKALVARWMESGDNRGFYLRSQQAWAFSFSGRNHPDPASRPTLAISTDQGSFTPPCLCNAKWTPSSEAPQDSRAVFQVAQGQWFAIVQFDLSGVKGTVSAATLELNCESLKYAGLLEVFEADPPRFRIGGGGLPALPGLAAGYPLDQGLAAHPSVLFASDFADIGKPKWIGSASSPEQVADPATQSTYLRAAILKGELGGCSLEHNVVSGTAAGLPDKTETELYARYYVYLDEDWGSTVDANKMPGWDNRMGWWNPVGYWQSTTGNGGSPGTGLKVWNAGANRWEYEGHSLRGHGGTKAGDGNPYDDLFWLGGYIYHLDQGSAYGEGVKWPGVVLDQGHWHAIEHYVKMNSISGPYDADGNGTANADGVYRVWVDGVLSYQRSDFRWRRHPEMGLQGFWLNWYHGGTQPSPTDMHFRMNSVVIAREYIGPRRDG